MFLSTPHIRPFIQDENAENASFKKPGSLKPPSNHRTPFKDRSVNRSVSPSAKFNTKLQLKQHDASPFATPIKKSAFKEHNTPLQDRPVNSSVSFSSKLKTKLQTKQKDASPLTVPIQKATVKERITPKPEYDELDDLMIDLASSKEFTYADEMNFTPAIFDMAKYINNFVSKPSPKYEFDEDDFDGLSELPLPELNSRCFDMTLSPLNVDDVPLPIFNY